MRRNYGNNALGDWINDIIEKVENEPFAEDVCSETITIRSSVLRRIIEDACADVNMVIE